MLNDKIFERALIFLKITPAAKIKIKPNQSYYDTTVARGLPPLPFDWSPVGRNEGLDELQTIESWRIFILLPHECQRVCWFALIDAGYESDGTIGAGGGESGGRNGQHRCNESPRTPHLPPSNRKCFKDLP